MRVLKAIGETRNADGEAIKAAFAKAASEALGIDHNRVYFAAKAAITTAAEDAATVLLTFDLLPEEGGASAAELGKELVANVADPSSLLYGEAMREGCPVDSSFMPVVRILSSDGNEGGGGGGGGGVNVVAAVLVPLAVSLVLGALCFLNRKKLRDSALRKLALWRFEEVREGGGEGGGEGMREEDTKSVMHSLASKVRGAFGGGRFFAPAAKEWQEVGGDEGEKDDGIFSLGDVDDEGTDVRGGYAVAGGGRGGGGGGGSGEEPGTELVVVKKQDEGDGAEEKNGDYGELSENFGSELMGKKKRVIQIEL